MESEADELRGRIRALKAENAQLLEDWERWNRAHPEDPIQINYEEFWRLEGELDGHLRELRARR